MPIPNCLPKFYLLQQRNLQAYEIAVYLYMDYYKSSKICKITADICRAEH